MRELRNIRLRRGLSQADLSAITGVAEYTISEIEAGKRTPRPSTLRKLAQGLGVEVADLYGEADNPLAAAPPSQPSFNHLLEERRSPSIAKAVSDVAEHWHEMASNPDASPREISEAVGAALALGEALMGRFGPPSASNYTAEQWEAIHLAARLLEIAEAGNGRILGLGEEEQNRARQEQIRELTRRISA